MNKNGEWSAARRIFIILMDVLMYNVAIYSSFLLKFHGEIPMRNFETFQHSAIFISVIFIALNILLGVYVFYNRTVRHWGSWSSPLLDAGLLSHEA